MKYASSSQGRNLCLHQAGVSTWLVLASAVSIVFGCSSEAVSPVADAGPKQADAAPSQVTDAWAVRSDAGGAGTNDARDERGTDVRASDVRELGAADVGADRGSTSTDMGNADRPAHEGGTDGQPPMGHLGPSDVSMLFPLPARLSAATALRLDSAGARGPLLPRARFDSIDVFRGNSGQADPALAYERFRIVGVRFDPCFPSLQALRTAPATCRRQIRLVAQPLDDDPSGTGTQAADSAIHLLYDLDEASFQAVIARLVGLRGGRPPEDGVLGINPLIAREGAAGATAEAIRALILAQAGEDRLSQFTFMQGQEFTGWKFGGLRVQPNRREVPLPIAGTTEPRQTIFAAHSAATTVSPATSLVRALGPLLGVFSPSDCPPRVIGCVAFRLTGTPAEQVGAMQTALDIENPRLHHAEDVDCAGCHLAGPLRGRGLEKGLSTEGLNAFRSTWNLSLGNAPEHVGKTNVLRAFGYFGSRPVLSQRAVNESAAVAEAINEVLARP